MRPAPAVTHLNNYANVFGLNQTFMKAINQRANDCGFPQYMEKALTFPPAGKFQEPANATNDSKWSQSGKCAPQGLKTLTTATDCLIWEDIVTAAIYVNPCFNFYHLTGESKP
jgi:carboxypeptidase D